MQITYTNHYYCHFFIGLQCLFLSFFSHVAIFLLLRVLMFLFLFHFRFFYKSTKLDFFVVKENWFIQSYYCLVYLGKCAFKILNIFFLFHQVLKNPNKCILKMRLLLGFVIGIFWRIFILDRFFYFHLGFLGLDFWCFIFSCFKLTIAIKT